MRVRGVSVAPRERAALRTIPPTLRWSPRPNRHSDFAVVNLMLMGLRERCALGETIGGCSARHSIRAHETIGGGRHERAGCRVAVSSSTPSVPSTASFQWQSRERFPCCQRSEVSLTFGNAVRARRPRRDKRGVGVQGCCTCISCRRSRARDAGAGCQGIAIPAPCRRAHRAHL